MNHLKFRLAVMAMALTRRIQRTAAALHDKANRAATKLNLDLLEVRRRHRHE